MPLWWRFLVFLPACFILDFGLWASVLFLRFCLTTLAITWQFACRSLSDSTVEASVWAVRGRAADFLFLNDYPYHPWDEERLPKEEPYDDRT